MSYTLKSIAKYSLLTSIYVIYWILKKIIRVLYVTLKQTVKMIRRTKTVPPESDTEFLAFYLGEDFNEPYDILGFGSHKGRIANANVLQSRTPIYRCDVVSLRPTRERDENGSMMYEICKHNLETPYVVHTKFSGHVIFARNIAVFYDGQSDHGFTKDFGRVLFEEGVIDHVKTNGRGIYIMLACWSMDKECFIVKENPKEPPKQITPDEVKEFERYRDYNKRSTTSIPSLLDITINPVSENKNPFALAQSCVTEKENRIVENPQTNNELYQREQPEKTYTGIVCRMFENFQTKEYYYVVYNNKGCAVITPDSRQLKDFPLDLGTTVKFVPRKSHIVILQEYYDYVVVEFDRSTTSLRGEISGNSRFLMCTIELMFDPEHRLFYDYDRDFRVYDEKRLLRAPSTTTIYTVYMKNRWVSGEGVRWEIDSVLDRRQAPLPSPVKQDRCDEKDYCMSRPPLQRVSLKSRFSAPKYQMAEVQTNIDRYESRREDRTRTGDTYKYGRDRDHYRVAPVEDGMKKLQINSNEERRTRDRRDRRLASSVSTLSAPLRLTPSPSTHLDKRMEEVNDDDDVKSLNKENGKEEDSGIKESPVVGNVAPSPTGSDGETKEVVKKPTPSTSAAVPSPRPTPVHQPNQYGQYGRGGGGVPLWLQREQREHPTLEFLTAHQGTSEELLDIAFADPRRAASLKPGMFEKIMKTARKLDAIKKKKAEEALASQSQ